MTDKPQPVAWSVPAEVNQRAQKFWARQSDEAQLAGAQEPVPVTGRKSWMVPFAEPVGFAALSATEQKAVLTKLKAAFERTFALGFPRLPGTNTAYGSRLRGLAAMYGPCPVTPPAWRSASKEAAGRELVMLAKQAGVLAKTLETIRSPTIKALAKAGFIQNDLLIRLVALAAAAEAATPADGATSGRGQPPVHKARVAANAIVRGFRTLTCEDPANPRPDDRPRGFTWEGACAELAKEVFHILDMRKRPDAEPDDLPDATHFVREACKRIDEQGWQTSVKKQAPRDTRHGLLQQTSNGIKKKAI